MKPRNELPPAYAVANHCAQYSWRQDLPGDVRLLLEIAADSLREQYRERLRCSSRLEQVEAEVDLLRRINYGPQKGGAA